MQLGVRSRSNPAERQHRRRRIVITTLEADINRHTEPSKSLINESKVKFKNKPNFKRQLQYTH